jgi:hypothetical protein
MSGMLIRGGRPIVQLRGTKPLKGCMGWRLKDTCTTVRRIVGIDDIWVALSNLIFKPALKFHCNEPFGCCSFYIAFHAQASPALQCLDESFLKHDDHLAIYDLTSKVRIARILVRDPTLEAHSPSMNLSMVSHCVLPVEMR